LRPRLRAIERRVEEIGASTDGDIASELEKHKQCKLN
ncbi:unnamed protein product, partial [Rotaria socialis]